MLQKGLKCADYAVAVLLQEIMLFRPNYGSTIRRAPSSPLYFIVIALDS